MATKRSQPARPLDAMSETAAAPQAGAPHAAEGDNGNGFHGGAGANPNGAADATATLTATPAPAPLPEKKRAVERRRSPREKHIAPAVLQPPSGDASAEASHGVTVQDLSLGGVGFRATEKFAPGETYRITLGKGPLLLNARIRIISCRLVAHRTYHVGAEFC